MSYCIHFINDMMKYGNEKMYVQLAMKLCLDDTNKSVVKVSKVPAVTRDVTELKENYLYIIRMLPKTSADCLQMKMVHEVYHTTKIPEVFKLIKKWAAGRKDYDRNMWEDYNYFKVWNAVILTGANGDIPVLCTIGCNSIPEYNIAMDKADALTGTVNTMLMSIFQKMQMTGSKHKDIGKTACKMFNAIVAGNIGAYMANMGLMPADDAGPEAYAVLFEEVERCARLVGARHIVDLDAKIHELL